ncbi:hypothetical protein H0X48_03805 [Candidatus Dependentiae bacterium]|nr:hypothetical protein [Candidatus Dependentiae bacterium]
MSARINYILIVFTLTFSVFNTSYTWFGFFNKSVAAPKNSGSKHTESATSFNPNDILFTPTINVHVNSDSRSASASAAKNSSRQKLLDSSRERAQQHINSLSHVIMHNKFTTALTVASISYIALQSTLLYLRHNLYLPDCWSKWHNTKTLSELYTVPQPTLAKQLINDIQHTYTKLSNPLDFTTPLISFVRDLETEIKYLNLYKSLIKKVQLYKINRIIWFDDKLLEETPDRLHRLAYIKNTFFTWLVDHKIEIQKPLL